MRHYPWQLNPVLTVLSYAPHFLHKTLVSKSPKPPFPWTPNPFFCGPPPKLLASEQNPVWNFKDSLFQQNHPLQTQDLLKKMRSKLIPLLTHFFGFMFLRCYISIYAESWGDCEGDGDTKAGTEVRMDGEEHWGGVGSSDTRLWHQSTEPVLLLARERCMGGAQVHSREQAMDISEEDYSSQWGYWYHQFVAAEWWQSILETLILFMSHYRNKPCNFVIGVADASFTLHIWNLNFTRSLVVLVCIGIESVHNTTECHVKWGKLSPWCNILEFEEKFWNNRKHWLNLSTQKT